MTVMDVAGVLGGEKALRRKVKGRMDVIDLINAGVTKGALARLAGQLGLTMGQMSEVLPVTERTIQRYTPDSHFSPVVSEHIVRIAEVAAKGAEVFGDKASFNAWLRLPNRALADKAPVELFGTGYGTDMVLDELVRMEHGTVS